MIRAYLLHAGAVHFPIALLFTGWAMAAFGRRWDWTVKASSALLWLGTASAWIALGLGLLAEKTAPHVPSAWQALERHESLAYWTAGAFTALSLWRWRRARVGEKTFLALWLAACALLLATAFEGGELVFEHGMGVGSGPN
ncbi:MAG: hypothetical protein HY549_11885 [Elusimicrobia bacterium]|nr:hypothetical protein [Elusimicrobiota bacterium]